MTTVEIQQLLHLGENARVEFKAGIEDIETIGRVVSGFLNTTGGFVICGIGPDHNLTGLAVSDQQLAAFERSLHEDISPKTLVSIQRQEIAGQTVVVIEIPEGQDLPYSFRNVIYIRHGAQTRAADGATIRDMVLTAQIAPERWERRGSLANIETDIAAEEVMATVRDAQRVQRAFFADPSDLIRTLENLSAAKYGRLTNGGDVLFAQNPAARLPQTRVRAMRYNSDKAGDTFSDMKSFEGPLKSVFEEAYSFIVRNTPSVSRFIPGNPQRQDSPLYPEEAVREALINALAHRDYAAASGGVAIHIFPRRLEIWNSGALPEGVTEDNLPKGHISVLRNPDIAHALYLRGLMEKAGRGSVLMVRQCRDAGLPDPFWKSDPKLGVTVTLPAPEVTPEATPEVGTKSGPGRDHVTPQVAPHVTPQVTQQDTPQDTQQDTPQVTPQVHSVLVHLETDRSRDELMGFLGLKDRNNFSQLYLNPALSAKVIERTIPEKPFSKNQRYRLTALGKALRAKLIRENS
jgi:ATP-dependent DNA helicase RecG